jgi:hypothetical protein
MPASKKTKAKPKFQIFGNTSTDLFISSTISGVFLLVVLTFQSFYFINPFAALTPWLAFEQLLSTIGWVLFIVAMPVVQVLHNRHRVFQSLGLISFALYPVALILIHLSLWVTTGNAFVSYLGIYPIFFFTDLIAPTIYLFMWLAQRRLGK